MIADLTTLGLAKEAVERRVHSIGGSDANTILSGNEEAILALWEEKTGRREPEDLSTKLPVVMGQWTEPLNAAWFTQNTGLAITQRGQSMACTMDAWRTATIDGMTEEGLAVWEAKHTNAFVRSAETIRTYMPQLHHNMDVAGAHRAHLSVFRGNMEWLHVVVDYDSAYGAALHRAEWEFWLAVLADEPPVPYPAVDAPVPLAFKEVCMEGNNAWAACAGAWLETKVAAERNAKAKEQIKTLVAPDVAHAYGHGVGITRDKRGALRISVMESQ